MIVWRPGLPDDVRRRSVLTIGYQGDPPARRPRTGPNLLPTQRFKVIDDFGRPDRCGEQSISLHPSSSSDRRRINRETELAASFIRDSLNASRVIPHRDTHVRTRE